MVGTVRDVWTARAETGADEGLHVHGSAPEGPSWLRVLGIKSPVWRNCEGHGVSAEAILAVAHNRLEFNEVIMYFI